MQLFNSGAGQSSPVHKGIKYFFLNHRSVQQQFEFESEHPQVGSEFLNIPLIIPAAQPTPELTVTACVGQFIAHAPHSIQ